MRQWQEIQDLLFLNFEITRLNMNALVKTAQGEFPNPNFYAAWKGFKELRYQVHLFEDKDMDDPSFWMSCGRSTPVFAGVPVFEKILEKLGVKYHKIDTYPTLLCPFLNREVVISTLGSFRKQWNASATNIPKWFMKPVAQKLFTGRCMNTLLDWMPMVELSEDTEVYLAEPVRFLSEFRVYVSQQKILAVKHYAGDWSILIDKSTVEQAVTAFASAAPCAYALDFGVTSEGKTSLVEFNDATSLGNYGLSPLVYASLLVDRWNELTR